MLNSKLKVASLLIIEALPFVAVGGLLACLALLTVFAGPVHAWLELPAAQLHAPAGYIEAVLGTAGEVR